MKRLQFSLSQLLTITLTSILIYGCSAPYLGRYEALEATNKFAYSIDSADHVTENYSEYDELWIVEKSRKQDQIKPQKIIPGLFCELPEFQEPHPLPLKHTKVTANIALSLANVQVAQHYYNPYKRSLEVTYNFPLPQNAAVTDFIMQIGDRKIRGLIREKEEAKMIYQRAKSQGHTASLLTQQRPNIFTQKIANIAPQSEISVELTYFNTIPYRDGEYVFAFPTTIGPRFFPPGCEESFTQVFDNSKRNGHDIELSLNIEAGKTITALSSPTHLISTKSTSATSRQVTLSRNDRIPNRDFILNYQLAETEPKASMIIANSEKSTRNFLLTLHPPKEMKNLKRIPREMIFIVDCSGSMSGRPLQKMKETMIRCLKHLDENDSYQIIRFSEKASPMGSTMIPATTANIKSGIDYVNKLRAGGGTYMLNGIRAALEIPKNDSEKLRFITFLTDGYIGNEKQMFREVRQKIGQSRVFSFGIGDSVNHHLIEGLARAGNGAAAYVGLEENSGQKVTDYFNRVCHPALTDITLAVPGMQFPSVQPSKIPNLYIGRPITLTGTINEQPPREIFINGNINGFPVSIPVEVTDSKQSHEAVDYICNYRTMRRMLRQSDSSNQQIIDFSIANRILSPYTAFLAVDSMNKLDTSDKPVSVHMPNINPNQNN